MSASSSKLSRRSFARIVGAGAAVAAIPLELAVPEQAVAGNSDGTVRICFNENPYGPSPAARRALERLSDLAWQYPMERVRALAGDVARMHGVPGDSVLIGNGSSEILQIAALTHLSPSRGLVVADPTYEALEQHAAVLEAQTVKVPLTTTWAHDLPKMLAASKRAGILYICNPNNPTGSITPKASVKGAVKQAPADTLVIVDEAYAHYVTSTDYESMIPMVSEHPNLIVLRTFSKIYGIAGLRCGFAVGQPATLKKLRSVGARNSLNIAAILAARASLGDSDYVERSRKRNADVREMVTQELERRGFSTTPSEANFFMVDLGREVRPVIDAMRAKGVLVGRPFPPLGKHLRVTVGTEADMRTFLAAFEEVMRAAG